MAKGWTTVGTIWDMPPAEYDRVKADRYFSTLMKKTKTKSAKDLKEEGIELYKAKIANDDALLDAYENKRLKNKDAIKQAMAIKREREASSAKKKEQ